MPKHLLCQEIHSLPSAVWHEHASVPCIWLLLFARQIAYSTRHDEPSKPVARLDLLLDTHDLPEIFCQAWLCLYDIPCLDNLRHSRYNGPITGTRMEHSTRHPDKGRVPNVLGCISIRWWFQPVRRSRLLRQSGPTGRWINDSWPAILYDILKQLHPEAPIWSHNKSGHLSGDQEGHEQLLASSRHCPSLRLLTLHLHVLIVPVARRGKSITRNNSILKWKISAKVRWLWRCHPISNPRPRKKCRRAAKTHWRMKTHTTTPNLR